MRNVAFMAIGALAMAGFGWGLGVASAGPIIKGVAPIPASAGITITMPPKVKLVPAVIQSEKLAQIAAALHKPKTAGDLGTPFRLSAKQMYIDPSTSMAVNQALWVVPHMDYEDGTFGPYIGISGKSPTMSNHSFISFGWAAAPNKAYYFDCVGSGSQAADYKLTISAGSHNDVSMVSMQTGHIKQVILPDPAERSVGVGIIPMGLSGLVIHYCEVTPVN